MTDYVYELHGNTMQCVKVSSQGNILYKRLCKGTSGKAKTSNVGEFKKNTIRKR